MPAGQGTARPSAPTAARRRTGDGPGHGAPAEQQQREQAGHASLPQRREEVVMGLVGVRVKPGGEQRLRARRTEPEQPVAALVQLHDSWISRLRSPLLCALRPMELTSRGWLPLAAHVPAPVQREHGQNVPSEAQDQRSPAALTPTQPRRR